MEAGKKRYVGLDLAKRTLEVCIVCDGTKPLRYSGIKSDATGRNRLASLLRSDDVVAMETSGYAFMLTRFLERTAGCAVYILHPRSLRVIGDSTRKTDKEDAYKLATYIQRTPEEEMPLVSLPSEQEEELRGLISHKQVITRTRTALINRLHAVYVHAGHTTLKKKHMVTKESREAVRDLLENACDRERAASLERQLETVEQERDKFREKIQAIVSESELSPYMRSIPGVGPALAAAFLA
jgi:transposase